MLQPVSLKSREPQVSQDQNQSVSRAESHSVGTRGECTSRPVQVVGRIRLHELLGLRSSFPCCVSRGLPLALSLAHGPYISKPAIKPYSHCHIAFASSSPACSGTCLWYSHSLIYVQWSFPVAAMILCYFNRLNAEADMRI